METKIEKILKKIEIRKKASRILAEAAHTMQENAKGKVKVIISNDGMTITVETTIPLAIEIEYGIKSNPFFNPALEAARNLLLKKLNDLK